MCPQTENEDGRLDSIDPATFVRNMSSKALAA